MSKKNIDPSIAQEAISLVTGDRQAAYGHPSKNFQETADLWSVVLGIKVTAEQVALCMMLVKVAREVNKPKRDNLVDAIGYLLAYDAVVGSDLEVDPGNYGRDTGSCICSNGCTYCTSR